MEKRRIVGLLVFIGLALAALFFFSSGFAGEMEREEQEPGTGIVQIGGAEVEVDVVATPALRERGLSGRASLDPSKGMLFLYELEGIYGIWMPDMNFAIDIIWIDMQTDSSGTVATVAENVAPETYPEVFYPERAVSAILEVSAGFVREHDVKVGDEVSFKDLSVEPL